MPTASARTAVKASAPKTRKRSASPKAPPAAAAAAPASSLEADVLTPKHIRFGQRTYAAAEARARAEGRDYIDVLRAFTARYAAGESFTA